MWHAAVCLLQRMKPGLKVQPLLDITPNQRRISCMRHWSLMTAVVEGAKQTVFPSLRGVLYGTVRASNITYRSSITFACRNSVMNHLWYFFLVCRRAFSKALLWEVPEHPLAMQSKETNRILPNWKVVCPTMMHLGLRNAYLLFAETCALPYRCQSQDMLGHMLHVAHSAFVSLDCSTVCTGSICRSAAHVVRNVWNVTSMNLSWATRQAGMSKNNCSMLQLFQPWFGNFAAMNSSGPFMARLSIPALHWSFSVTPTRSREIHPFYWCRCVEQRKGWYKVVALIARRAIFKFLLVVRSLRADPGGPMTTHWKVKKLKFGGLAGSGA